MTLANVSDAILAWMWIYRRLRGGAWVKAAGMWFQDDVTGYLADRIEGYEFH
jgi:hypothetical protein